MTKTKRRSRRNVSAQDLCGLTGLPRGEAGRRLIDEELARGITRGEAAALALVDLDEFRDTNRLLGKERADQVLKAVARRIKAALPEGAIATRLAGDCFAVLLPDTEPDAAIVILSDVCAAVRKGPVVAGKGAARREAHPTVSAGIAGAPRDGSTFDTLLVPAQAALRRAKSLGRDRAASPPSDKMILKSSYYTQTQLERLKQLSQRLAVGEATILREALEDVLIKHKDRAPV